MYHRRHMIDLKKSMLALATITVLATGALAACGSDRPEFCDRVDTLQNSITQLTSVNAEAGVLDTIRTDLETVETNAQSVVDSARTDFPRESSDLENSIDTARESIQGLPSSPSPAEITAVALNVSAVANSARSFEEATSSACS
jgi:hypothetical protein